MSDKIIKAVHAAGAKHGVNTKKYDKEIKEFFNLTSVKHLSNLRKKIHGGDSAAAAEGEERLHSTILTLQHFVNDFRDENKAANLPNSELLERFAKGLEYTLSGTIPS